MKHLALFIFLLLPLPALAGGAATPCTDEDTAYSEDMGYGSSASAFRWGLEIQKAVRNKDLIALFAMVDGELWHGPRKAWALKQDFDDIFPPDTFAPVLQTPPSCRPVGWRGYMLGQGLIWYEPTAGNANIRRIFFAAEEPVHTALPDGWRFNGRILSPDCFAGQVQTIATCQNGFDDFEIQKHSIVVERMEGTPAYHARYDYRLLAHVPTNTCQALSGAELALCDAAYLVDVGAFTGGTIGRVRTIGVYGLFDLPAGPTIRLLKKFESPADGLNFVLGMD